MGKNIKGGSKHKKYKQQKYNISHGGHAETSFYFIF